MQDQPLHMIQQIIDEVDGGLGQFIAWVLGLVHVELVIHPAFHHPHHQGELSSTTRLAHPMQ